VGYTSLAVTDTGVVLCAFHARRLALAGPAALEDFARFAREAQPGFWTLRALPATSGARLQVTSRPASRLFDGIPTRAAVSPFAAQQGPFSKPPSPSGYDPVRAPGVATLLTSADGAELLESCSAAVIGWDGSELVCVPEDRPRVWSTAEAAVRARLSPRIAPLPASSDWPLLLVNAVKRTCPVSSPGRRPFPPEAAARVEALFRELTGRTF